MIPTTAGSWSRNSRARLEEDVSWFSTPVDVEA
jgi:hypothetical protein